MIFVFNSFGNLFEKHCVRGKKNVEKIFGCKKLDKVFLEIFINFLKFDDRLGKKKLPDCVVIFKNTWHV
jgi:hypothetical protein